MNNNENLLNNDLQIDAISQTHLKETAMWARFLSILGIVVGILLGIGSFFIGALLSQMSYPSYYRSGAAEGSVMVTLIYLVLAAITIATSLFLFRFATKMKQAIQSSDQSVLNQSFLNLKLYFRVMGIIAAIYVVIVVLAMLVGLFAVMVR